MLSKHCLLKLKKGDAYHKVCKLLFKKKFKKYQFALLGIKESALDISSWCGVITQFSESKSTYSAQCTAHPYFSFLLECLPWNKFPERDVSLCFLHDVCDQGDYTRKANSAEIITSVKPYP